MGVFILERPVTAREDALAVTTYVMNGFNNTTECVDTWRQISGESSLNGVGLYTHEDYVLFYKCHPITATGKALLISKDERGEIHLRTMIPLMLKLLAKPSVVLVNIVKDKAHDMIFSMEEITRTNLVNDNFTKNILFDKPSVGRYMHSTGDDSTLEEFALRTKANGDSGIVVIYDDVTMSQIQRIENKLWHIPHESVVVTVYATFHLKLTSDTAIKFEKIGGGLVDNIALGRFYRR